MQLALSTAEKKLYPLVFILAICVSIAFLFIDFPVAFISLLLLSLIFAIYIKPVFGFYLILLTLIEEQVRFSLMIQPIVEFRYYLHLLFLYPTFMSLFIVKNTNLHDKFKYGPVDVIILMIVGYETISLLWSPSALVSFYTLIIVYSNLLLFFLPRKFVKNKDMLKKCINLWIVVGILVCLGILLTYDDFIHLSGSTSINKDMGFIYSFKEHNDRASGLAGSDHAAGFLVLTASLVLGKMALAKQTRTKVLYLLLFLFIFYCNLMTATRATVFAQIVLFFLFLLINTPYRKKTIKYSVFFLVVLVVIILLGKPGMIDRTIVGLGLTDEPLLFQKEITQEETLENVSGMGIRIIWWKEGLDTMLQNPLLFFFGLGVSGFVFYTTSPEVNGIIWAFFYDMGLIGGIFLLLLLAFLFKTFKPYLSNVNFKKMDYVSVMLICLILGYIADSGIHGLVDYDLTGPGSRLVWFPLGFILAILQVHNTETQIKTD